MRRALKGFGVALAVIVGLVVVLVAIVWAGGNTGPGRRLITSLVPALTGHQVAVAGVTGRFPDRLRIARVELRDATGVWATADDVAIDWSPLKLLDRAVVIERFAAARVAVARAPVSSGSGSSGLPVAVDIAALHVARLELAAGLTGAPAALSLDGSLALASLQQGTVDLTVAGLDGPGHYRLQARLDPAALQAHLTGGEPAHGLVARLATLPDIGALAVDASLSGPHADEAVKVTLAAGPLHADAHGTIDLDHRAASLTVAAAAPAMTPRPDLSWQNVSLDAQIDGPFVRPAVSGKLVIDALHAAGAAIDHVTATAEGNSGEVKVKAALTGTHLPGPHPDLFAASPIAITAAARLDQPDRPVQFTVRHPLVTIAGTATTAGVVNGKARLVLTDLAPLAAVAGVDLHGRTTLDIDAALDGTTIRTDAKGTIAVTGGAAPVPALVGDAAKFAMSATVTGSEVTLTRLNFDGKAIRAAASGQVAAGKVALDWSLGLPDLARVAPNLAGTLQAQGHVAGPIGDFAATATLAGTLAPSGQKPGPVSAKVELRGLPAAPAGEVTAQGTIAGSPLALDIAATRAGDGTLKVTVNRADWKSAHAEGGFTLPAGARLPLGKLDLRMTRLDDLQPLLGQPLAGAVSASVVTAATGGHKQTRLRFEARNLGIPGTASNGQVVLTATIDDPLTRPVLKSRLVVSGKSATGVAASAQLDLAGPQDAIGLRLTGTMQDLSGSPARLSAAATLDAGKRAAVLSALQVNWKGQDLRLLGPARFGFAKIITVDRLRLGLGRGTIALSGRASPTLDLTVALRNLSADLAAAFVPGLTADGTVSGDARLTGTPARPTGTIRLRAAGLHLRSGPGQALPPANITATANLAGTTARIDARLNAGSRTRLTVTGQAATIPSAPLALRVEGSVDLAMLNPLLGAAGRRAGGKVTIRLGIAGTVAAPRVSGTVQLAGAEVQDFTLGAHITNINGTVEAAGTTIRLTRLQGRAGPGTIGASGTVDLAAPGMPVALTITAHNARPLASDLLTAAINADLSLRGTLAGHLVAGGTVTILHAEIGIPKTLPAHVPVLNVRLRGAKPPPPAAPGPAIGLNLTIAAHRVVVRGRGVFAELAGKIQVGGTVAAPQPLGRFHLVRGNVTVAGQTLSFAKGEVGFDGGSLADPSLDFAATSASTTMSATLSITGTASHPKITLSSIPDMPQDEILAYLLFNRSASSLSPFELASVASTLAELTGVTSGVGDPLASVRSGLGLQRLSVGTSTSGAPTLQGGRYIARGVYLGAQAGAGNSSQARIEIDITKGLKAIGTVGTGTNATPGATPADSAGTSLGLQYQFEY